MYLEIEARSFQNDRISGKAGGIIIRTFEDRKMPEILSKILSEVCENLYRIYQALILRVTPP